MTTDTTESDTATTASGTHGAPSILSRLKERREALVQANVWVNQVPRWTDPELVVRFQPVPWEQLDKVRKQSERKGAKPEGWLLNANMDILIKACIGVYARIDGREYVLDPDDPIGGEPSRFDPVTARALGLDPDASTARDVVRAVYLTDGDILSTTNALGDWSGYKSEAADEELQDQLGE